MKKCTALLMLVCFSALALLGAGCGRLTKENYDKIKVGQTYTEVTALLGDTATCETAMGAKNCIWGDEQKNITVKFIADKVVFTTCKGI